MTKSVSKCIVHKIYHLKLLQATEGKTDFYFGSQAAIYDTFTPEAIGITLDSLRTHIDLKKGVYENAKVTIRLGEIKRKQTNRGKRV